MNGPGDRTRRSLLGSVAALAASALLPSRSGAQEPSDRGIGGTGVVATPPPNGEDRGIGGTGVIGTIRRFGSIHVNGLRIAYPKDVPVEIDGAAASVSALRLGHVVTVLAQQLAGTLTTSRIVVESEVVGLVAARRGDTLTVLGQRVLLPSGMAGAARWKRGDRVGISGLRRPDGVIVASLVQPRGPGQDRVAGPVVAGRDGQPAIAGLRLAGLDAGLVGQRLAVVGTVGPDGFAVSSARPSTLPVSADIRQVSLEAYIERGPGGIRTGSGFEVRSGTGDATARGMSRAVLTTRVDAAGRLDLQQIRPAPLGRLGERERNGSGEPARAVGRRALPGEPDGPGGVGARLPIDMRGGPSERDLPSFGGPSGSVPGFGGPGGPGGRGPGGGPPGGPGGFGGPGGPGGGPFGRR